MKDLKKAMKFLKLAWKIRPAFILLLVLGTIISSCQTFANVILPKYLIDELIAGNKESVVWLTVGIVLSNMLFFFCEIAVRRGRTIQKEYIVKGFHAILADKVMSVEYQHLENPYYLDLKERAIFAVENQSVLQNIIRHMTDTLKLLFTIVGLAGIMCRLSVVFVIFLIITIGIIILVQGMFSGIQQQFYKELIPINRRYGYFYGIATKKEYQKDLRLYDMSGMVSKRLGELIKETVTQFKKLSVKWGWNNSLMTAITVIQTGAAYGYVAIRCITNRFGPKIGIGSFTMYVSSAIKFSTTFIDFGKSFVGLNQMLNYADPFMELLAMPEEKELCGNRTYEGRVQSLRFEHVSFAYPKTDKKILDDVSFEIHEGEKISIVGLNGAGKTTLVKLLCRLYRPDSGGIYLNGIDIFEYEYESYLTIISAVFQDYKLFDFTIEENVTCKECGEDTEGAVRALTNTGLSEKIQSLEHGVKTLYGKEYDKEGIELSGGQSQKVAIARALYKDADFIILDEPTSALDPIAEAEIYEQFNNLVESRTAIYISHRMSSSVFCDKILVLDGGKVSDFAPHNELMQNADSLYYKMFMAQAVNYQLAQ